MQDNEKHKFDWQETAMILAGIATILATLYIILV